MVTSNCAVCDSKESRFIRVLSASKSQIPLVGPSLF